MHKTIHISNVIKLNIFTKILSAYTNQGIQSPQPFANHKIRVGIMQSLPFLQPVPRLFLSFQVILYYLLQESFGCFFITGLVTSQ